jgi:hypothetical protein
MQSSPRKALSRSRTATPLNPNLDRKLLAYFAAGTASLAASARPAEAKIIYTPASINIQTDSRVTFDLNNDGIPDFNLYRCACASKGSSFLTVFPEAAGNGIRPNQNGEAAAGFFGLPVGPKEKFSYGAGGLFMAGIRDDGFSTFSYGPWRNVTNRYLGLKFVVNGQNHYGWARLNVSITGTVVITGYAYETTPDTGIIEGHVSGAEKVGSSATAELLAPAPQTASLSMLALGAPGLPMWRREDDAAQ